MIVLHFQLYWNNKVIHVIRLRHILYQQNVFIFFTCYFFKIKNLELFTHLIFITLLYSRYKITSQFSIKGYKIYFSYRNKWDEKHVCARIIPTENNTHFPWNLSVFLCSFILILQISCSQSGTQKKLGFQVCFR